MGTALALRERRPVVPGTPTAPSDLKNELRQLARQLNVADVLAGLNVGTNLASKMADAGTYLLELDVGSREVLVKPYARDAMNLANEDYLEAEKKSQDNPNILSVLVSVETIKALRSAYPNYYLDARGFLRALKQAIA